MKPCCRVGVPPQLAVVEAVVPRVPCGHSVLFLSLFLSLSLSLSLPAEHHCNLLLGGVALERMKTLVGPPSLRWQWSGWVSLLLGLLLQASQHQQVLSEFLDAPQVLWTLDLPAASNATATDANNNGGGGGGGGNDAIPGRIVQGNAVAVSPNGAYVYVTEADGRLHVISVSTKSRRTYVPSVASGSTTTSCSSGVALHGDFAVYAVVDGSTDGGGSNNNGGGSSATVSSRLIAVDSKARERWSVSLGGTVVGTPFLSGNHVYVARNTNSANGFLSVIAFDATLGTAELVATVPDPTGSDRIGLVGPPAGHRATLDSVTRDVVVVALASAGEANNNNAGNSGAGGNANANSDATGGLYALVPSSLYDDLDGRGAEAYNLRLVSTYPLPTSLRPAFDGTNCYLAHESRLAGWDGEQSLLTGLNGTGGLVPKWETRRSGGTDDQSMGTYLLSALRCTLPL